MDVSGYHKHASGYRPHVANTGKCRLLFWTYMLLCENGAFYTGQTRRLVHRCFEHYSGHGARYTRANQPRQLVYYEAFATRSAAMKREYRLRQLSHEQKQRLVDDFGNPPSLRRANQHFEHWQAH